MKRISKDPKILRTVLRILIPAMLLVGLFFLPRIMSSSVSDFYSVCIFPVIAQGFNILNGCFQISLTENVVIIGSIALLAAVIVFVVKFLIKLLGKGGAASYAARRIGTLLIIAIPLMTVYQLMHGINFNRTPVRRVLDLDGGNYTIDQYIEAMDWAYYNMATARKGLGEDYRGVAHTKESFESMSEYANGLLQAFSDKYDIGLSSNFVRAKPVSLSKYWSLTRIVGMYDPFLGEANINTGYIDITSFPVTLCHELCHAKGYASETDCNIIAVLACTMSTNNEFRYAGYYYIFWDLYGVVYDYVLHKGGSLPSYMSSDAMKPVYRDMAASQSYWDNIDKMFMSETIAEVSESANDAFLKSNGTEGVSTYTIPQDVYLDYYMTIVKPTRTNGDE